MTREEAIKILENPPMAFDEKMWQALQMAIESLSAEPTNLISREEAIKEIENRIGLAWTESEANYNRGMEMALSIIEALPSVSAEKLQLSEETSTMGVDISTNTPTDLISRAELLDRIKAINSIPWGDDHGNAVKLVWSTEEVKRLIEKAPSADRPSGEWIPCSERLPSKDGCYLVTTTGTNNDIIDIAYYTEEIWHKASRIKAWMPLPKPYCPNCGAKMGSDVK